MDNFNYFIFEEHTGQINTQNVLLSDLLKDCYADYSFSNINQNYLGIDNSFVSFYYVGLRWIEYSTEIGKQKSIIWVKPKHSDIPIEKLLATCIDHPVVCNHLQECYFVSIDEPLIPVPDDFVDYITPLIITDFLIRVQKIVRKGLKKNFINVKSELRNRIKGKILISQSNKIHLKKNVITDTFCSYQIHTINCIENQIIKAALLQSCKYIYKYLPDRQNIKELLAFNLTAFEDVSNISVYPVDFNSVHNSSFYHEYKPVLALSRLILKSLGFSLNADISVRDKTVPPFYINMPELFERYCEVMLRKKYSGVLAGYHRTGYSETKLGCAQLRPDFIIPSQNCIIDSKYKYWIEGDDDIAGQAQLSLYARHFSALKKLNQNKTLPVLQILYPNSDGDKYIDLESGKNKKSSEFIEMFKLPVKID